MLTQPEQPQEQLPPALPENKHKKVFIFVGAALIALLLAGAAFLAGTLMNRKVQNQNGLVSMAQEAGSSGGPVTLSQSMKIDEVEAKELPTIQSDVQGVFVSRSGSSFTIGTGNMGITVISGGSSATTGSATPQSSYDGPTYDVVVTKDTLIYKDTTPMDFSSSSATIQQTVALGSLDDLTTKSMISVWGKKTGNRYVADVILYSQPMIKAAGGTGGTLNK